MVLRIFRHFVPLSVVLLAVSELMLTDIVWYYGLSNFSWVHIGLAGALASPTLRMTILAATAMVIAGLYHSRALIDYRVMVAHLLVGAMFLTPITILGVLYWREALEPDVGLSYLYLKAEISWLVCILITRAVFLLLADLDIFKARIVVLGTGQHAAHIAALVAAKQNRYFVPVAYLHACDQRDLVKPEPFAFSDEDREALARFAAEHRATEVVVATDDRRGLPVHALLRCRLSGVRVTNYLDFLERETKSVNLDALQPGWLVYSDGFRCNMLGNFGKRCVDVVFSLIALILTLPLLVLAAALIKLESPGPALYRQKRVGLGGQPFTLFKFRSMRADAEKDGQPRWASTNDPRITRVGAIIRKIRLDEVPQFINVLRGEMSIVGPRPERPEFVAALTAQIPYYAERHCVKPGITGWAQICYHYGGSMEDAKRKLAYDLYYVKNHGVFLDMIIMLQTGRVIFWADGAR